MNQKGFTIVELLAAIVILGLIVTIVYPVIISSIQATKKKAHDSQEKIVEKAMKMYYLENPNELRDIETLTQECMDNNETSVYANNNYYYENFIKILIDNGYISENETKNGELIDPCTDEPIRGEFSVKWICSANQYEYKFRARGC